MQYNYTNLTMDPFCRTSKPYNAYVVRGENVPSHFEIGTTEVKIIYTDGDKSIISATDDDVSELRNIYTWLKFSLKDEISPEFSTFEPLLPLRRYRKKTSDIPSGRKLFESPAVTPRKNELVRGVEIRDMMNDSTVYVCPAAPKKCSPCSKNDRITDVATHRAPMTSEIMAWYCTCDTSKLTPEERKGLAEAYNYYTKGLTFVHGGFTHVMNDNTYIIIRDASDEKIRNLANTYAVARGFSVLNY